MIDMLDSKQDEIGACVFTEKENLNLESIDVSIKKFLESWGGELTKYVIFSYKGGRE